MGDSIALWRIGEKEKKQNKTNLIVVYHVNMHAQ